MTRISSRRSLNNPRRLVRRHCYMCTLWQLSKKGLSKCATATNFACSNQQTYEYTQFCRGWAFSQCRRTHTSPPRSQDTPRQFPRRRDCTCMHELRGDKHERSRMPVEPRVCARVPKYSNAREPQYTYECIRCCLGLSCTQHCTKRILRHRSQDNPRRLVQPRYCMYTC